MRRTSLALLLSLVASCAFVAPDVAAADEPDQAPPAAPTVELTGWAFAPSGIVADGVSVRVGSSDVYSAVARLWTEDADTGALINSASNLGGAPGAITSVTSSLPAPVGGAGGTRTFRFFAEDAAGNRSWSERTFTFDVEAPLIGSPHQREDGATCWTIQDAGSGVASATVREQDELVAATWDGSELCASAAVGSQLVVHTVDAVTNAAMSPAYVVPAPTKPTEEPVTIEEQAPTASSATPPPAAPALVDTVATQHVGAAAIVGVEARRPATVRLAATARRIHRTHGASSVVVRLIAHGTGSIRLRLAGVAGTSIVDLAGRSTTFVALPVRAGSRLARVFGLARAGSIVRVRVHAASSATAARWFTLRVRV